MQPIQANHIDLVQHLIQVVIPNGASQDVHLRARGQEDGTSQVVMVEGVLHVAEAVEQLCGTLVIAKVNNPIVVQDVRLLDILLDRVFDCLQHRRDIMSAHFSKGPVPEVLSIGLMVMLDVLHAVMRASVVAEPDIVASFVELHRHGLSILWRGEPRVS